MKAQYPKIQYVSLYQQETENEINTKYQEINIIKDVQDSTEKNDKTLFSDIKGV